MNPSLLIAVPLLFAFIIPLTAKIHKYISALLVLAGTFTNLIISLSLYSKVLKDPIITSIGNWNIPFAINLYLDKLALFSIILISFISFIIAIYNLRNLNDVAINKYNTMFLIAFTGINGIILTGDIFNLFVFLEIAAISTYVLVTMKRKNSFQAAFKYLVMGSIASVFLLIAIGLLYSSIGSLNMAVIANNIDKLNPSLISLISLFLLIGIGFEAELFPMNFWVPEVYSKSHIGVTSFISGALSLSGIYAFIRIYYSVFNDPRILSYIMVLGIITLLFGELVAYQQKNIKKMLAYSSIAQMGLIVTVISLNTSSTIEAGIFQLFNHSILKVLLFISAGFMTKAVSSNKIKDLAGLGKKLPIAGFGFTIGALGIMGVPFLSGFVSKMMIIQSSLGLEKYIITGLILFATLVEISYYLKVIQNLYFNDSKLEVKKLVPCFLPIGILSIIVLYVGIKPQFMINIFEQIGKQIIDNSNYIFSILGGI